MFLDYLPDVLQQIAIASIILFASFKVGERKKTKEEDPNFRRLVVWNSILVGVLYAEAIFLEVFISEEDPPIIDDSGVTVPAESKTTQWLKGHNDFFWFFLAIHQSILLGIIFFELMSSSKRSKMIWFGAIPPAIQWLIGKIVLKHL